MFLKCAGLNPLSYWHHNDHIGVVCVILKAPLLLSDKELAARTASYYPGLELRHLPWKDYTLDRLAQDYDVFLRSDLWKKEDFAQTIAPLEKKLGKRIRTVHCPHGFSDKGFWLEKCVHEDLTLIYGQHMLDMLKERGVWEGGKNYVITGNYRLSYYKQHQESMDRIVRDEVFSQFDKQQPTILYAPTWQDEEQSSTFFEAIDEVVRSLPQDVNLLIKLHPMLEEKDIASLYAVQGKHEGKANIYFLDHFPLVYPILFNVDAYLGDASAVGYDFLATGKPMAFLADAGQELYVHRCGHCLRPGEYGRAIPLLLEELSKESNPYGDVMADVHEYTFGEHCDFSSLREDIIDALTASA